MKKFFSLLIQFMKRNLLTVVLSFLFPVLLVFFSTLGGGSNFSGKAMYLNLDKGGLGEEVLRSFERLDEMQVADTEEVGEKAVQEGEVDVLYILPEDYSASLQAGKVPSIRRVFRETAVKNNPSFELHLETKSREILDKLLMEKEGIEGKQNEHPFKITETAPRLAGTHQLLLVMVSFSILYGSALIATDLIMQKKQKVLRRSLSTPTKGRMILLSSLAGAWVIQFFSHIFAVAALSFRITYTLDQILLLVSAIFMMCIFSVCFQLFLLRIFKDPNIARTAGMLLAMIFFFLPMFYDFRDAISGVPEWLFKIAYISPVYWVLQIAENGSIAISLGVIALMSLVLFTAGSVKLEEFAE